MAWMRQQVDDQYHGVVQLSSFYGFEATGDSEVSVHPIMNMEFCTPDDDDAESCNGDSSSDITFIIDDYSNNNNNDDDNYVQEYENEYSYDGDYKQGDSWRCQKTGISNSTSGSVHLEQNNKDSRVGISSGSDNDHHHQHEHEDQMNEMEQNKLFWDTCLGIGEESSIHEKSFNYCTYSTQLS